MSLDFDYNQSLSIIKGVGEKILAKLAQCGLHNFRDLLFYFPIRYENKTKITSFLELIDRENAVIEGVIKKIYNIKKNVFIDLQEQNNSSSILRLMFFNLHAVHRKNFKINTVLRCYGAVRCDGNQLSMMHPDVSIITDTSPPLENTLSPVYSTTEGLHQSTLRKIIQNVLDRFTADIKVARNAVDAFIFMHHPSSDADVQAILNRAHPMCQYLIREELYTQLWSIKKLKLINKNNNIIKINKKTKENINIFIKNLDFELTEAQKKVIKQITEDVSSDQIMMRLMQGDVGSGKTIVAAMAALLVLSNEKQVALMAPTEILAYQLFKNFSAWFEAFGFKVVFLSGNSSEKEKANSAQLLEQEKTLIAIGTHALFQASVQFSNLALIIIDEQHRFGVHQRLALMNKSAGQSVHQLVMTATPIPRTLAMIQYAHLAISVIDSLPKGRQAIKTVALSDQRRMEIIEKISNLVKAGQQIYWLCTVISDSLDYQTAQACFALLQSQCAQFSVGLIHGHLSSLEKEQIMHDFKTGLIQILVTTTVIEVGVDVPNATLIVIENPERLGLAQLHQLRGRVGRGPLASFCILLYKLPLSEKAKERLDILRLSQDGFIIAEKDLELRGSGEISGLKQSGISDFKIADLLRDKDIILEVSKSVSDSISDNLPDTLIHYSDDSLWSDLSARWIGDMTVPVM